MAAFVQWEETWPHWMCNLVLLGLHKSYILFFISLSPAPRRRLSQNAGRPVSNIWLLGWRLQGRQCSMNGRTLSSSTASEFFKQRKTAIRQMSSAWCLKGWPPQFCWTAVKWPMPPRQILFFSCGGSSKLAGHMLSKFPAVSKSLHKKTTCVGLSLSEKQREMELMLLCLRLWFLLVLLAWEQRLRAVNVISLQCENGQTQLSQKLSVFFNPSWRASRQTTKPWTKKRLSVRQHNKCGDKGLALPVQVVRNESLPIGQTAWGRRKWRPA